MLSHALVARGGRHRFGTRRFRARRSPGSIRDVRHRSLRFTARAGEAERQAVAVDGREEHLATESLHQWALSLVCMWSPAPSSSLVTRVRLHESGGTYKKARLLIASASARRRVAWRGLDGFNHPPIRRLGAPRRFGRIHTGFINLGDWWSVSEVPKDDDASWRGKLRKFLLDIGVKE